MDHLQLAVFLSMLGAFLIGGMVGHAIQAMWAWAAGYHAARIDTVAELTAALNDPQDLRNGGVI